MTCHNRRDRTLAALTSLKAQSGLPAGTALTVHLVDAGSSDGTAAAVRRDFPETDVVTVGSDVYWGTGTRIAAERADPTSHVLLLNDDVLLTSEALAVLLRTAAPLERPAIAIGAMRSSDSARTTYSGYHVVRAGFGPPRLVRAEPDPWHPTICDTCNGNAVLVTNAARRVLGDVDTAFPHRMGDMDYGLRARKAGIPVLLCPGHLGTCDDHSMRAPGSSGEAGITALRSLRRMTSVRELPPGPWWEFCRRHFGAWAPLHFCSPYARTLSSRVVRSALPREKHGVTRPSSAHQADT
ncbi:glycosyltransferase family 2 protein [Streptomyces sp. PSKA54]|uniref:Glycosyltransferase family 2 protein n=1 Tax=Streptomyces himalayensis subsp. aureolus TaxID=2758039 RepID=A0A7W2HET9_9ACTN|nr:glycosyltransferase family 2 protein [Streptomyces himalayensis subsp. aureolus]